MKTHWALCQAQIQKKLLEDFKNDFLVVFTIITTLTLAVIQIGIKQEECFFSSPVFVDAIANTAYIKCAQMNCH